MAQEPHQMVLSATHSTGEEEWVCPVCGRRVMIAVSTSLTQPGIAIYVMSEGETEVAHTFAPEQAAKSPPSPGDDRSFERVEPLTEEEETRLAPFIAWLETVELGI